MWLTYLLYFFVAFISKAILGVGMCYLLFSTERTCDGCDAETIPIRMGGAGRLLSRLMGGRLQRRWCPRCGWQGITRTGGLSAQERAAVARSTRSAAG
jgi:hypothetical protein